MNWSLLTAKAKKKSRAVTEVLMPLVLIFLIQENLHLWKLEGQHRLCHAGAGGHDREVRDRGGVIGHSSSPSRRWGRDTRDP